MQSTILPRGGSIWSGYEPEEDDEDEGPWIWCHFLRFAELNRKPYNLTLAECHEIVQLANWIGQYRKLTCDPPIIDDDPHPDGPPPENIYYRGAV